MQSSKFVVKVDFPGRYGPHTWTSKHPVTVIGSRKYVVISEKQKENWDGCCLTDMGRCNRILNMALLEHVGSDSQRGPKTPLKFIVYGPKTILAKYLNLFSIEGRNAYSMSCGNYAVLVDLHILPLGGQDNASWFSPEHRKEVGSLIRNALEPRVRQFQEARFQKIQPKPRKDLTLTAPLCLEGGNVRLAVHFMKRHINLRCIVRRCYRELRVFPERVLVCASPPENSALPSGNLNLDVSAQSQSRYFSSSAETIDPLSSSTATKRAILQKIARQTCVQPRQHQDDQDFKSNQFQKDGAENESAAALQNIAGQANVQPQQCQDYQESRSSQFQADDAEKAFVKACHPVPKSLSRESLEDGKAVLSSKLSNSEEVTEPHFDTTGSRRRPRTPSSSGEDVDRQKTKRSCVREPALSSSIAPPDTVCSPQPDISQTNQSGLAASLRGLSVKPVFSGSSISSRLAPREGRKGGEPRTSRLRRLKKS